MHRKLAEKRSRGEFAFRCTRKRDRDERHEKMNQRAIQNAAHNRTRDEHRIIPARRVVNDRRRERDQEMEEETQRSRSLPALERNFAHRAARNELQQPFERAAFRNKKRRSAGKIEHSANGTSNSNHSQRRHSLPFNSQAILMRATKRRMAELACQQRFPDVQGVHAGVVIRRFTVVTYAPRATGTVLRLLQPELPRAHLYS